MIIKMNKYSFLIFHKEYSDFLLRLRDLGVVHIRENNDTKHIEEIKTLLNEQKKVKQALDRMTSTLKRSALTVGEAKTLPHSDALSDDLFVDAHKYIDTIADIDARIAAEERKVQELTQLISELDAWGDFDPDLLDTLSASGQQIAFWTVPTPQYKPEWEDTFGAIVISELRRVTYFVTVTSGTGIPDLQAERVYPPMRSMTSIDAEIQEVTARIALLKDSLLYISHDTSALTRYATELEDTYNMNNALLQGEHLFDDTLHVLEGFIPETESQFLEQSLDAEGYAYAKVEIREGENVPVKLKNNFFVRAFEPIVKLFSLPNYHELDPTPFVAPFFMLFFAICFGDSGYGLLLFGVCTYMKMKAKESLKPFLTLFQFLGAAGVVVGFFSGSFFGVELARVEALASIRHFFISSDNMMIISIALGLTQIILAKFVGAYKVKVQMGMRHALSPFAWTIFIVVILASVLFGLPQLSLQVPPVVNYIMYGIAGVCAIIMLFFNSPGKNLLFNLGSSLWTAYNTASGLLGDTLSYIRLFAIGLTGAILGSVFNTLAFSMSDGLPIYVRWIVVLFILLLGHGINFGLTMIGALVHPIRLIFVEYFNNSSFEGGGKAYTPLKEVSSSSRKQ